MKTLIVTAFITALAGCAGTGYSSSGDTGEAVERDRIFNSWIS